MKTSLALLAATLLVACSVDEVVRPVDQAEVFSGTLAADIRGAADVRVEATSGGALTATLTLRDLDAEGLFPMPLRFEGQGRLEAFPEANLVLTTATAEQPATSAGACAGQPVSLALALERRGGDARVGGSLTAYCGARRYGVPARIFRLSGDLPRQ